MFIDDRKKAILKAIIDDYIDSAEPIGSRTIAKKCELGLSSATIRNEMADLEELGFLAQPYTSSGRIPSDKGYRLYVDELMRASKPSVEEIVKIKEVLELQVSELNELISKISNILSHITKYTSVAITPEIKGTKINAVQVVPIVSGKALIVVVTDSNIVKNTIVNISELILPDDLIRISNIFNEKLKGLTIEGINWNIVSEIMRKLGSLGDVLVPVLDGIKDCIDKIDDTEVYVDGTTNILYFPEFKDISRAREFLNLLETKETLQQILTQTKNSYKDINIRIGSENTIDKMKDCSLITVNCSVEGIIIGCIGLIGPTRMEYSRVIYLMELVKNKIDQEIYRLMGKKLDGG